MVETCSLGDPNRIVGVEETVAQPAPVVQIIEICYCLKTSVSSLSKRFCYFFLISTVEQSLSNACVTKFSARRQDVSTDRL